MLRTPFLVLIITLPSEHSSSSVISSIPQSQQCVSCEEAEQHIRKRQLAQIALLLCCGQDLYFPYIPGDHSQRVKICHESQPKERKTGWSR